MPSASLGRLSRLRAGAPHPVLPLAKPPSPEGKAYERNLTGEGCERELQKKTAKEGLRGERRPKPSPIGGRWHDVAVRRRDG